MAVIKSGVGTDQMTVGVTSKGAYVDPRDPLGRSIAVGFAATYSASGTFTPPATPQDLVMIFGSATKTVRVKSIKIGTQNTAAGSQEFRLSKRSAVSTGGTVVAATAIPHDSVSAAATATVSHVTTSANTPGTALGNVNIKRVASPVLLPATWAGIRTDGEAEMLPFDPAHGLHKPIVLNGVGEGLAINFNGAALVSGQIHTYSVVWTEE